MKLAKSYTGTKGTDAVTFMDLEELSQIPEENTMYALIAAD